jgi:Tfp pilus assembly protein FimT
MELMITISIMGIILAAGIPGLFRAMKREGLRKAVSDVVEGCSHARAQAIFSGKPVEFVLRAESGHMTVEGSRSQEEGSVAGAFTGDGTEDLSTRVAYSAQLHEEVAVKLIFVNFKDQMEAPEVRVRFYPNGTSEEFTLVLLSPEGERKIGLDIVTGRADVEVLR